MTSGTRPLSLHPHRRRVLLTSALSAVAVVAGTGVYLATAPTAQASAPGTKDVTAVLFEWDFNSIATECTNVLGPFGYGFVQVSPPQETIQGSQWWTSYQPVSYDIAGRLGTREEFAAMVTACHDAGVKVVVDSVINHMTAGSGTGTGGTVYTKYEYPGYYSDADFHDCRTEISDYTNRTDVQECELLGLSDLDTSSEYVQQTIADYLDDLASLGVDGYRIDAAKHISETDLAAIKAKMDNPDAYWKQEVIYSSSDAVQPDEYTETGDVQEFRYATSLKQVFLYENLSYLSNFGTAWGFLDSSDASVFVDNHDTERNGSTLNYQNDATYTLANVFMLAWPYGSPDINSGYEWSDTDTGPPNDGTVDSCYTDGWKCQHYWMQIANMVGFRNAVSGTSVTDWWDNGGDQIAFGRGSLGYVVVNHESSSLTKTFQTSLPAGTYCDVQHGYPTSDGGCTGTTYTVDSAGQFTATVGSDDAIAIYVGAAGTTASATATASSSDSGTVTGASFSVYAETVWGENIYVVGDNDTLGNWDTSSALLLSSASYPTWTRTVSMTAGTTFAYKYIMKDDSGNVTWESGENRTATVPDSGLVTLSDTWRD